MTDPVPPFAAPPSHLRLRLDSAALAANWCTVDRMSGKAAAGAAVKADAYGLGAGHVVPVLAGAGCRDWFVAHWSELADVLPHVEASRVAVLHGPLWPEDLACARATGVRPVLNSLHQVALWLESGGGPCHVMVDTGINRLGLALEDLADERIGRLDIDCCISHLASADEDVAQNARQLARFGEVRTAVRARRYSLANSAGIALGPDYHADLTRPGMALYGGIARPEYAGLIRQVAHPEVALLQTRMLAAGDCVGYNATFTAPQAMRVGVVALGYADGYLRCWSGKGALLWQGQRLPVLGRVSMDLTVVDLEAAPACAEGDWLAVDYEPVAAAKTSGLSQYELFTVLRQRFTRLAA